MDTKHEALEFSAEIDEEQVLETLQASQDASRQQEARKPLTNIPGLAADPSAFVRWAKPKGYDMTCHPLHFLFLNEKTYAARDGWNACKEHYGIKGE